MCTFLSTLPKKSKTQGTNKKRNLVLSLKECPNDENGQPTWYRVRLLNFSSKTTSRDYPFIARYVHQKWGISDKGFSALQDEVVCPVTKFVDWDGDRYDCPICKYAQQQFSALKESNWKDADARKKNKEYSRKFQGIIPVYVVTDPVYEGNNDKFKVIILNDKKFYDEFIKKVEKQLLKANCFNGVNAVNCCIHVSMTDQIVNEGQPNEYHWKQKVIDKIAFERPEKASDIVKITSDAIDTFPYDDEYYISSSKDELKAFYNKYIKVHVSNDDIDDSDSFTVYDTPKQEPVKKITNETKNAVNITKLENIEQINSNNVSDAVLNELTNINKEEITESTIKTLNTEKSDNIDIDDQKIEDLLNGIEL